MLYRPVKARLMDDNVATPDDAVAGNGSWH